MKIIRKIIKVIGYVVLVLLIMLSVTLIIEKEVLKRELPSMFGYSFLEIQSDSMNPSIRKGNIIIIKDQPKYSVGDVITYYEEGNYITHEIISINDNSVITKGTNNNTSDNPFYPSNIIGIVKLIVPVSKSLIFTVLFLIIIVSFSFDILLNKNRVNKNSITVGLVILIVGISSSFAYGAYKSAISVNGKLNAAAFIAESNIENSISYLITDMYPGEEQSYNFNISNYKNNTRSEVDTNYTISLESSNNLPLEYKLYKNSVNTNIFNNNLTTTEQILYYNVNQIDNYQLIISWDSLYNDPIYSGLVEYIDIIINSNQFIETS